MTNENLDLTKREDISKLMRSSKSEKEWNDNCDKVKAANKGYPSFWYSEIIISGVLNETKIKYQW